MVGIRPLTAADRRIHDDLLGELDQTHYAALPHLIREPNRAGISEADYLRHVADPATFFAGIETETGLVGFVRASLIDSAGGRAHLPVRYARIEEIIVRNVDRRRGFGHALMSAVRDWAKNNALESLELSVYAFNAEALAFYEREGFEVKTVGYSSSLD